MIAELLTTMMMALGVATNNGSNAFNQVEKISKPSQKAVETIAIQENYYIASVYEYTEDGKNVYINKYYVGANNTTANYQTNYFLVRNSTYIADKVYPNNYGYDESLIWQAFEISNYYDDAIRITIDNVYYASINTACNVSIRTYQTTDPAVAAAIDLTLTPNTYNELATIYNKLQNDVIENTLINSIDNTVINTVYSENNIQYNTGNITIPARTTVYILTRQYISTGSTNNISGSRPDYIRFDGSVLIPENTYEIVDIPNIMFTVLTMPFSFISTAFNLTVFPGTPYAVNFGNLFLTIIAVFILLWLIQKVFK